MFKVDSVVNTVCNNSNRKIELRGTDDLDSKTDDSNTNKNRVESENPQVSFKNFVRIRRYGIIYDFFTYAGAGSKGREKCDNECIVIRLVEEFPNNQYFRAFVDSPHFHFCLTWRAGAS